MGEILQVYSVNFNKRFQPDMHHMSKLRHLVHDDPFSATELAQQNLRQQSEDEFDIQLSLLWINDSIEYD